MKFVEVVTRDRGGSMEICCGEGMTIMDESPALQCIKHAPIGQGKKIETVFYVIRKEKERQNSTSPGYQCKGKTKETGKKNRGGRERPG